MDIQHTEHTEEDTNTPEKYYLPSRQSGKYIFIKKTEEVKCFHASWFLFNLATPTWLNAFQ